MFFVRNMQYIAETKLYNPFTSKIKKKSQNSIKFADETLYRNIF